jgi:hypothetical protein
VTDSRDVPMHSPISSCVSVHLISAPFFVCRAPLHQFRIKQASLALIDDVRPMILRLSQACV